MWKSATKAKKVTTMAQKLSPKRGVRNTKGGARRKRIQRDKRTKAGPKTISTRASAITNDTDSANTTDSEREEEDLVEVVGEVMKNTRGNLTTEAMGNQL